MEGFDIEDFSIEKSTGFLSPKPPLSRLPTYYDPWEDLVSKLPALNQDRKTREAALELPLLEVNDQLLNSEEAWKRAYVVLTFLGQSYIWVEGGSSSASMCSEMHCCPVVESGWTSRYTTCHDIRRHHALQLVFAGSHQRNSAGQYRVVGHMYR